MSHIVGDSWWERAKTAWWLCKIARSAWGLEVDALHGGWVVRVWVTPAEDIETGSCRTLYGALEEAREQAEDGDAS